MLCRHAPKEDNTGSEEPTSLSGECRKKKFPRIDRFHFRSAPFHMTANASSTAHYAWPITPI